MEKLFLKTTKLFAEASFDKGVFVILKGSKAKKEVSHSYSKTQFKQREKMLEDGIIIEEGDYYIFSQNFPCNSPSEASSLITGSATNGMILWKDINGKTLKSIMREDL